jgi:hypothetical protein
MILVIPSIDAKTAGTNSRISPLISGEKIPQDNAVTDNPLVQNITYSMNQKRAESIVVMFVPKAKAVGL